ncbi:acyl-phosphate glycerol 3-phosphate acyltransferase [Fusobacterium equinum]|uniref:Glycerol-3-phosphate acyltransferase n=2 Tax=Fusobacteriaceae TaxID=203492 RepID=A0A133NJL1_9FUSO|nr:acyl-phosphate glycerol 3-phosphate acyltransferase [Fusobacterium equinum]
MKEMKLLFFIIIAYFLGSLPSGVWIGKITKNIDIRNYGSKNSGATNAYRILGAKYGLMVLFADALKGFLAVALAAAGGLSPNAVSIVALVVILGHSLSFFLAFKGGKGVATSLGVFLFLEPKVTFLLILIFIAVVFVSRYISLGSIIAAGLLPILTFWVEIGKEKTNWLLIFITLLLGAFVVYRHKSNIIRLLEGKENKFKL